MKREFLKRSTYSSAILRIGLLLLLFASCTISVFADEQVLTKAFTVKFKEVGEVASLVNSLLSDKGAVTIQPKLHTLVVQDFESNLREIEMAIAAFDTPPPTVEISLKLVRASKNTQVTPVSEEIKQMAKLGEVLKFNQYVLLDSSLIQSEEGQPSVVSLAKDYQLSFITDVVQEGKGVIRLKNFQLKKRKKEINGKESFIPLISLTLNLRNAETLVLGASRFEESDQALMVILLAKVKS
jgi:type II secretory pathway component GspD/PulD (secretin)